jgi:hypothetical protein
MGVEQTIGIWYKMFGDPKGANDALDSVGKKGNQVGAIIKKALAVISVAAVGAFANACINAQAESDRTAAMLNNTLKSVGGATDKVVASTEAWVDKMEMAKSFDDSQIRAALQSLTIKYGDVETAQKGVTVAMEAARAKNIDLATATQQVYMGSQGLSKSLRDYGVEVVKGTTASGYLDKILGKVAGSSDTFNKSLDGAKQRMAVLKDNVMESIGSALMPLATLLMEKLAPVVKSVMEFVQRNTPAIQKGLAWLVETVGKMYVALKPTIDAIIQTFGPYVKDLFTWLGKHGGDLQSILVKVAEAIGTAFRIVASVIKAIVDSIAWVINNAKKVIDFLTPNTKAADTAFGVFAPSTKGAVPHASGGWAGLNGPELSLLGERGPERVMSNKEVVDNSASLNNIARKLDTLISVTVQIPYGIGSALNGIGRSI